MKFLTLLINPPEEIKPILAKRVSNHGYSDTYSVIDLDPELLSIDNVIAEMQNTGVTHWGYIEDEGNE